ncbi:MAG: ATP phosphoribosyltransferase [Fervidobacterium sp.]|uniref:ATP phosphoribosyltransferase n=1 Tax=Fervidobacterium sp. TaxID=1871331 RepID=UPI00404B2AFB
MLKVAVPKGRLEDKLIGFFENAGYTFEERSSLMLKGESLVCYMVRPFDVPTYLINGVADIGFCGTDVLLEREVDLIQPFFIPVSLSRMILAGPENKEIPSGVKRIATKFPNIAKRYCELKGWHCQIIQLKGSVELAPVSGLADLIVDISETGRTLKENNLKVFDEILTIRTFVVVNPVSYRTKRSEVMGFLESLRKVIEDGSVRESKV